MPGLFVGWALTTCLHRNLLQGTCRLPTSLGCRLPGDISRRLARVLLLLNIAERLFTLHIFRLQSDWRPVSLLMHRLELDMNLLCALHAQLALRFTPIDLST